MQALESKLGRFGMKLGLERIKQICEKLGQPQDKLKVILVTGTNGKGSVTAALASILTAAGHRTGAFFSPHIIRYNERIQIDGKEITNEDFARYEKLLLDMYEGKMELQVEGSSPSVLGQEMTVFEALTAIAYKYFADNACEFAVMEIGMGGQYDATNIAMEQLAIITNVDLEHTEHLGDTTAKIAADKSCIIKNPKGIAITGCSGEALEQVRIRATSVGSRLLVAGEHFNATIRQATMDGTVFDYQSSYANVDHPNPLSQPPHLYRDLLILLAGRHQMNNAALAVAAADALGIDESQIRAGLAKVIHPGRLQLVCKDPPVLVDGAHNPAGIKTLVESLDIYPRKKIICVFTALKDKDWQTMLTILAPRCDQMIVTQLKPELTGGRAEQAEEIARIAGMHMKTKIVKKIPESIRAAKKAAGKEGMVLVCGSLYMLGEAIGAAKS